MRRAARRTNRVDRADPRRRPVRPRGVDRPVLLPHEPEPPVGRGRDVRVLVAICLEHDLRLRRVDLPQRERLERRVALPEEEVDAAGPDPARERGAVARVDRALPRRPIPARAAVLPAVRRGRSRSRRALAQRSRSSGSPPTPARSPSPPRPPACTGSSRSAGSSRPASPDRCRSGTRGRASPTTPRSACRPSRALRPRRLSRRRTWTALPSRA